jgi:hypothetical protein
VEFGEGFWDFAEVGEDAEVFAEVEEGETVSPAGGERVRLLVGGEEVGGDVAAAVEHGEFGFGPAVVDGWVDQGRSGEEVAVPEVAVEKGRGLRRDEVRQARGQTLQATAVLSG